MSGGNRRLVFNTRERVVSSDQNRHQAFQAFERGELLRFASGLRTSPLGDDLQPLEQSSYRDTSAAEIAPIQTPIVADVIDGLVVFPVSGSLNLLVSPGMVLLNDPDGQTGSSDPSPPSSDDSRAKLVRDPGIQVSGALALAAGAGATRIDLVEVRRQTVVLETDSRDIFDPSTGTFVPVSVTKVSEGRLIYRVTQGTPGGGIPARSQGWLPICVASVPSTATQTDDVTFWDVRPLVADRVNAPYEGRHVATYVDQNTNRIFADSKGTPGSTIVSAVAMSSIGIYKAGGLFGFNAQDAANQASGYAPSLNHPWYIYSVFPAGLPRWVKYASTPPRVPSEGLGVFTVSEVAPGVDANPFDVAINPPAATGLVTAGPAACLGAGNYTTEEAGFVMQNGLARIYSGDEKTVAPSSVVGTSDFYNLSSAVDFPSPARAVLVEIFATFTAAAGTDNPVSMVPFLLVGGTTTPRLCQVGLARLNSPITSFGTFIVLYYVEFPRIPFSDTHLAFEAAWGTSVARSSPGVSIIGWRL